MYTLSLSICWSLYLDRHYVQFSPIAHLLRAVHLQTPSSVLRPHTVHGFLHGESSLLLYAKPLLVLFCWSLVKTFSLFTGLI